MAALNGYWIPDNRTRTHSGNHKSVLQYLYLGYSIQVYMSSPSQVSYYAKDLLPLLASQDEAGGPPVALMPWRQTEFYTWLQRRAAQPWVPNEHTRIPPPFFFHKRRTFVRSTQPTPVTNKPVISSKLSRNVDGLRLTKTASKKRQVAAIESTNDHLADSLYDENELDEKERDVTLPTTGSRPSKLLKSMHYSDHDGLAVDADYPSLTTSIGLKSSIHGDDLRDTGTIYVEIERIPSAVPSGSMEVWACEVAGCATHIRAFDDQESCILEHLATHEPNLTSSIVRYTSVVDSTTSVRISSHQCHPSHQQASQNSPSLQLTENEAERNILPIR